MNQVNEDKKIKIKLMMMMKIYINLLNVEMQHKSI